MTYQGLAAIENLLNVVLMGVAYLVRALSVGRRARGDVICIFRLDSIGDFVIFSAALHDYRKLYKSSRLILIVRDAVWPLASACPYVDEVWRLPVRGFRWNPIERFKWVGRVSRVGCRVAVNAVYSSNFSFLECLVGWTCAPRRVGHVYHHRGATTRQKWPYYTELVPGAESTRHELLRNGDLLAYLGFTSRPYLRTAVWYTEEDRLAGKRLLDSLEGRPYMVIVPGSQMPVTRWPPGAFVRMITELTRRTGFLPVLCGSGTERSLCDAIQQRLDERNVQSLVLSGRTDLRQLGVVLSTAKLCIGNETGPLHMAVAVGTPVVCLLGGGHYGRFFPYPSTDLMCCVTNRLDCFGCDWNCLHHEPLCITGISVESVVDGALALHAAAPTAGGSSVMS